jgi:hypothetical protein
MSIPNTTIRTNRITAGSGQITTLNTASLTIRSATLDVDTLNANTITTLNMSISGELSAPIITELIDIQTDQILDISINNYRITDISSRNATLNTLILDLSTTLVDIQESGLAGVYVTQTQFNDLSARVQQDENKITDISSRLASNSTYVTNTQFQSLSGDYYTLQSKITSISNDLRDLTIIVGGYTLSAEFVSLSGAVNTNRLRLIDLCGLIDDLSESIAGAVTNAQILDVSNRAYADVLKLADISGRLTTSVIGLADVSGRLKIAETEITTLSGEVATFKSSFTDVSSYFSTLSTKLYVDLCSNVGIGVDPSNNSFIVSYDVSGVGSFTKRAGVVIGDTSDVVLVNGPTTFRNQVNFLGEVSVPASTTLIDTSGVTTLTFKSTTPYYHTNYIMFDTSSLDAERCHSNGNIKASEVRIKISRLSEPRNIIVAATPYTMKKLVVELFDDDDLSNSFISRTAGNILIQPGASPLGDIGGYRQDTSAFNQAEVQDFSFKPYEYFYDASAEGFGLDFMGRTFYTHGVVVRPYDLSLSQLPGGHPNLTANRLDITLDPSYVFDLPGTTDASGTHINRQIYHRYYQSSSYMFNIEFISTGQSSLVQRRNAHIYFSEQSRLRPGRVGMTSGRSVPLSQYQVDYLELLMAQMLRYNTTDFGLVGTLIADVINGNSVPVGYTSALHPVGMPYPSV